MDIVTLATLWFFGSALVGLVLGWLVGRGSSFALGLGVGLLIPGVVALAFSARCLLDYREFSSPRPTRVTGEVIAIEDRPVNADGTITQPAPVVRFTAADGSDHTVRGPAAGGAHVGDRVTVIHDAADPQRVRIGREDQLRGGAIAFMLFGSFPFSVGLWFVQSFLLELQGRRARPSSARPAAPGPEHRQDSRRPRTQWLTAGFNLMLVAGILWTGLGPGPLERSLTTGFAIVSAALWGHGFTGLIVPGADPGWRFGMFVLAANFSAWSLALWGLS